MAVESLECCLSRAIGSSCRGETQTLQRGARQSPAARGRMVWGPWVSCSCSVASPDHPRWPEAQDTPRSAAS